MSKLAFSSSANFAHMPFFLLPNNRAGTRDYYPVSVSGIESSGQPVFKEIRVDEKYATTSVHFQNKNLLEIPFMNSKFDSCQK